MEVRFKPKMSQAKTNPHCPLSVPRGRRGSACRSPERGQRGHHPSSWGPLLAMTVSPFPQAQSDPEPHCGTALLVGSGCLYGCDASQHSVVCRPRAWGRRLNLVDLVLGGHRRELLARIQVQVGQKKSNTDMVKLWEENLSKVRMRRRHLLLLFLWIYNI